MKCQGNFKFKGLQNRPAGVFTNERGEQIKYDEAVQLKLDEVSGANVYERVFRLKKDNPLIAELSKIALYQEIKLEFDVQFYNNRSLVIPVSLIK